MERLIQIQFYGRQEYIPARGQEEPLVGSSGYDRRQLDGLRALAEEQRLEQLSLQRLEAERFRLASLNYARMLRSDNNRL